MLMQSSISAPEAKMFLNTICSAVTDVYFVDQKTVLLYILPLVVQKKCKNEHIFMIEVAMQVLGYAIMLG